MLIKNIINSYNQELLKKKQNEVHCFRSLSKAITSNTNCYSKEFHGTRFLVNFKAKILSPYRKHANCELCDILYIVFSNETVRVAFIQAKRIYYPIKLGCGHKFTANLEQWELLHWQRKVKSSNKKVVIPKNILKSDYRSITSFIFFHPIGNIHDLIYCSASSLYQINNQYNYKGANGKVAFNVNSPTHHLSEILHSCNLNDFLKSLLSGKIGAPLSNQNSNFQISYIATLIDFLINNRSQDDLNTDLLHELRQKLKNEYSSSKLTLQNDEKLFLPKSLNIIKLQE